MKLVIPILLSLLAFSNQANSMISTGHITKEEQELSQIFEKEQRLLKISEQATKDELVDDTKLHTAIRRVDLEQVKEILAANSDLLSKTNKNKNTPLHLATYLQINQSIQNTQKHWNKINELTDFLIQKILEQQNSKELLNAKNIFGNTPLHGTTTNNRPQTAKKLLDLKDENEKILVERNAKDINNDTPIHCAASFGFSDVMEILATDENVLFQDKIGNTPMHLAAKGYSKRKDSNYAKSMLFLINKTESKTLFTKNKDGYIPAQLAKPGSPEFNLLETLHATIINVLGKSLNDDSVEKFIILLKEKMQEYDVQKITDFIDVTTNATVLYFASSSNKFNDKTKAIMENFEIDTGIKNNSGNTMLHCSARTGNLEIVEYLIKKQADINIENIKNETPLFVAFDAKQTAVIEYLLKQENINLEQNLKLAISNNKLDFITILLKNNAQVTPEILKLTSDRFIKKKLQNALKEQKNKEQQQKPTTTLTGEEKQKLIGELTKESNNKKNKTKKTKHKKTKHKKTKKTQNKNPKQDPEKKKLEQERQHKIKQLEQEKLKEERDKDKAAIKIQALGRGYLARQRYTLRQAQGKRVQEQKVKLLKFMSELGVSKISENVSTKKVKQLKKLATSKSIKYFAQLKDEKNHTVLHLLATYGLLDESLIQEFITNGGNINAQNNSGQTALHLSILNGYNEQSIILINNGADITIADEQKDTPLHWAILAHNNETLLTQEKNPKQRDNTELIQKLINENTINAKDSDGNTPLHLAAYLGHLTLTSTIIENGANVNTQNNLNQTPLHLAAIENHKYVVQNLVDNNANLDAKDNYDKPTFYYVNNAEHEEVAGMLRAAFNKQRIEARNTRKSQYSQKQYWR